MVLRSIGAVVAVVAFVAAGSARVVAQAVYRPALHVTLPMSKGFADATDALVEAQAAVRDALGTIDAMRLVDHPEESDAVVTVLGRGRGDAELTAALKELDPDVIAPPVMIATTERYILAMLSVGPCGDTAANAATEETTRPCYRRIVVGLGLADRAVASAAGKRPASNTWTVCAAALARDVRAWVIQNAGRLHERRPKA